MMLQKQALSTKATVPQKSDWTEVWILNFLDLWLYIRTYIFLKDKALL
jgi:hypothetical protein